MSNGTNIVAMALCAGVVFAAAMAGESAPLKESRDVAGFQAIEFRGTGQLDIVAGQRQSVQVSGDREAVRRVQTRVRKGVLIVSTERGFGWGWNAKPVQLQIQLPQLAALTLNGVADADVRGLAGGNTRFALQGNSRLRAEGYADSVEARINGLGTADLSALRAGRATVQVNGSGEVRVAATTSLDAALNGVGSLTNQGQANQAQPSLHSAAYGVNGPSRGGF